VPERSCVACRQSQPQAGLIRFVRDPGGGLVIDYRHRLPGRGAYTCIDKGCITKAVRNNAFVRALKAPVTVPQPETLLLDIEAVLRQRILNLLGMARKSGLLVSGSNVVLQELAHPQAKLLIVAADAAAGTAEKIIQKAQGHDVPWVRLFDKEKLGRAVGREERSHIVIIDADFARNLLLELTRLSKIAGEN